MIEEKDRLIWSGVFLGFARALIAVEKLGDDASHHEVCLAIYDEFERQRRIWHEPQGAQPLPDFDADAEVKIGTI